MHTTKGLIIGAILLAALILGGIGPACGAGPARAPASTLLDSAAEFTTFTDESNYFSISYPVNWSLAAGFDEDRAKAIGMLKAGVLLDEGYEIFGAGGFTWIVGEPMIIITVEPQPAGAETFDEIVGAKIDTKAQRLKVMYSEFREISRTNATIDGREAIIWEYETDYQCAYIDQNHKQRYLVMYTLVDQTLWGVYCMAYCENFTKLVNQFNEIVNSLRVYE